MSERPAPVILEDTQRLSGIVRKRRVLGGPGSARLRRMAGMTVQDQIMHRAFISPKKGVYMRASQIP
ncbi:hypothetical protein DA69_07620 [Brevundimonas naejangsanensis]|uniref:Uncharacterized protein n=1 Tax=Brevundimonas naejangsanensis TaxID=588932 RepID=A0A172Y5Y5_9CAUL|nr:hypothetical protein DA69_07620 [Brevundimonas naejangsanensis]